MSQANVELVRRFVVAEIDEGWDDADPGIVWNPVDEESVQGIDAAIASMARWEAEWDQYELFHEEFVDAGNRVVVATLIRGRGRGSGVEVEARFFNVYTLRGGKVVRMDEFTTRAEALEVLGLSE